MMYKMNKYNIVKTQIIITMKGKLILQITLFLKIKIITINSKNLQITSIRTPIIMKIIPNNSNNSNNRKQNKNK